MPGGWPRATVIVLMTAAPHHVQTKLWVIVSEVRCLPRTCHEAGVARRLAWVAGQAKQRNLKKLSSAGGFLPPGRFVLSRAPHARQDR